MTLCYVRTSHPSDAPLSEITPPDHGNTAGLSLQGTTLDVYNMSMYYNIHCPNRAPCAAINMCIIKRSDMWLQ